MPRVLQGRLVCKGSLELLVHKGQLALWVLQDQREILALSDQQELQELRAPLAPKARLVYRAQLAPSEPRALRVILDSKARLVTMARKALKVFKER